MFINPYLLSDPRLFKWLTEQLPKLLKGQTPIDQSEIKKIAYSSWHFRYPHHGDHLFNSHWLQLKKREAEFGSLCLALLGQVSRYHFEDTTTRIAVKMQRFDEWQTWVSNQSGLPVIAYKARCNLSEFGNSVERYNWLESQLGYRCLVSPYHLSVEDYIEQHGLNDTHIHLNGTSSLECMWNFALVNPQTIVSDLNEEFSKKRVQMLYSCTPDLDTPEKYEFLLIVARHLRRILIAWVKDDANLPKYKDLLALIIERKNYDSSELNWQLEDKQYNCRWTHLAEIELHMSVQQELSKSKSNSLDYCYLLYLLCMNNFQRLMVQRDDQFGFEQFQKFADNGIRESFEKSYMERFYQLHGPSLQRRPDLRILEGRFSPKKSLKKNEDLISSILRGFISYANGRQDCSGFEVDCDLSDLAQKALIYKRPTLKLIAHFIKQPSDPNTEWHFETLRKSLSNNSDFLCELLQKYPILTSLITGIDAAANELEAPPEVFAPLYRKCRYNGLSQGTYHVGEDFEHLLSGIRAVYEAITLLDLKAGDRLGHATAIGIDPNYWLGLMPEHLYIPRGQHFENLLFLRCIALNAPNSELPLAKIETHIRELSLSLFGSEISLSTLSQYFAYRGLEPEVVKSLNDETNGFVTHFGIQHLELLKAKEVDKEVRDILLKRWFDKRTLKAFDERIEIPVSMFSYNELLEAQQYTQRIVSQKHIVLEALPTSNVRISHYKSMKEHHIFRWLQIPKRKINGDHPMLVTLGSDDPGIFATDMRNEFYHIFGTLVEHFQFSVDDALKMTAKLNDNGRVFHFKERKSPHIHGKSSLAET